MSWCHGHLLPAKGDKDLAPEDCVLDEVPAAAADILLVLWMPVACVAPVTVTGLVSPLERLSVTPSTTTVEPGSTTWLPTMIAEPLVVTATVWPESVSTAGDEVAPAGSVLVMLPLTTITAGCCSEMVSPETVI